PWALLRSISRVDCKSTRALEAERESARAGRRGLGASEARSACGARASTGRAPRSVWGGGRARERSSSARRSRAGVGLGASEQRSARSARAADGPPEAFDGLAASLYGWAVDSLAMALATVGGVGRVPVASGT